MDNAIKVLTGSPSRDRFKQLHKVNCPSASYACDLDFILVAKYPYRIVAFLDYKRRPDRISFSEVIAYNILKETAPIYIVRSRKPENGPFEIFHYNDGDPRPEPPQVDLHLIRQCETWADFSDWEQELRQGFIKELDGR